MSGDPMGGTTIQVHLTKAELRVLSHLLWRATSADHHGIPATVEERAVIEKMDTAFDRFNVFGWEQRLSALRRGDDPDAARPCVDERCHEVDHVAAERLT